MHLTFTRVIITGIIFTAINFSALGQFNAATNGFSPLLPPGSNNAVGKGQARLANANGIGCSSQNTFYALGSSGVDELIINDTTATVVSNVFPSTAMAGYNLSYCNNLNGGSFTPTFYNSYNNHYVSYYNGTDWTATADSVPLDILNAGGNGDYLYYIATDQNSPSFYSHGIYKYDGHAINLIYNWSDTVRTMTVADLAVDSAGNVWFFTGLKDGLLNTDTLNVLSPAGQLLHQYPFGLNTLNAYGSFFANGQVYIGLGASNVAHPNSLVPVSIQGGIATAGTPISMPATSYGDLAQCTPGLATAIQNFTAQLGVLVFPNPAANEITIKGGAMADEKAQISIFDATGKPVFITTATSNLMKISTANFASGMYVIQIQGAQTNITQRLLVK